MPDMRVMFDKDYIRADMISNSTIYGIIRQNARETIDKAVAADRELARLAAAAKGGEGTARQALTGYLTTALKWNERDAALMVEYSSTWR